MLEGSAASSFAGIVPGLNGKCPGRRVAGGISCCRDDFFVLSCRNRVILVCVDRIKFSFGINVNFLSDL